MEKRKPIFKIRYKKIKGSPVNIEFFEATLFEGRLSPRSHYHEIGLAGRYRLRINGTWFCPAHNGAKTQYAFFNLPEIKELTFRAISNEIKSG